MEFFHIGSKLPSSMFLLFRCHLSIFPIFSLHIIVGKKTPRFTLMFVLILSLVSIQPILCHCFTWKKTMEILEIMEIQCDYFMLFYLQRFSLHSIQFTLFIPIFHSIYICYSNIPFHLHLFSQNSISFTRLFQLLILFTWVLSTYYNIYIGSSSIPIYLHRLSQHLIQFTLVIPIFHSILIGLPNIPFHLHLLTQYSTSFT